MTDPTSLWTPLLISLKITLVASIAAFALATVAAYVMHRVSFRGQSLLETLLMLPLVLPPTVVGFGLLVFFGKRSWVGHVIEWVFHQPLVFTWWAGVVAATVVAFPLVYQTIKNGYESVDPDLQDVARTLGASEWQVAYHVVLPLSRRFWLSGYMLGFARALGEFGATLMFAGDIPGKTETLPTAIYLAVETGDMNRAWMWVLCIALLSFVLMAVVQRMRRTE